MLFTWLDLEADPLVGKLLSEFGLGPSDTPVVACGRQVLLRNPSNSELAEAVGIRRPIEATVYDLLGEFSEWVFPVGRLDQDTSGLLLLTNDTQFGERLTNPEHKVPKTYLVKTATRLDDAALEQLRRGVEIGAEPRTLPAEVRRVRDSARRTWVEITITEGRNRQVRRMIEAVGSRVMKLVRIRIGPLEIGDLQIGRYRPLASAELAHLSSPKRASRAIL